MKGWKCKGCSAMIFCMEKPWLIALAIVCLTILAFCAGYISRAPVSESITLAGFAVSYLGLLTLVLRAVWKS